MVYNYIKYFFNKTKEMYAKQVNENGISLAF